MIKFLSKVKVILTIPFFTFALIVPICMSQAHVDLPVDLEGTLNRAQYKILVPANWNGTLLVYAHGYTSELLPPDAAPGEEAGEEFLLSMGYALAGTANRDAGWAVKEGIQNTLALTNFFKGHVGKPYRVILWGFSMGSVITFKSIEKYPGIYDGAIAGCAVGAGAPLNYDGSLALALAYDVAFGWPASWGSVGDVRDDLDFNTEVFPFLFGQAINPLNSGLFEFIRLVCDLPEEEFYSGSNWLFTDMFFVTQARAELEQRAHGPVAQNLDHIYSLTPAEIAYLAALGVDVDATNALLAAMNARTNIEARLPARKYLERYADYTGNLKRPVITIHTTIDGLVREANEGVYLETVSAAGKEEFLVQVFTDSVGHCTFEPLQLYQTVLAMEYWLDSGIKPGAGYFPAGLDFVPGFVPPPWPFK